MSFDVISDFMSRNLLHPVSGGDVADQFDDTYLEKLNKICGISLPEDYQFFLNEMKKTSIVFDNIRDSGLFIIRDEDGRGDLNELWQLYT